VEEKMKKLVTITLLLAGVAFLMPSVVPSQADAKITQGGQVNGGGNTPNGEANGVPTSPNTNPQGKAPPGQN